MGGMFGISDKTQDSGQVVSPSGGAPVSAMPPAPVPPPPMTSVVPALQDAMTTNNAIKPAEADLNMSSAYITSEPPKDVQPTGTNDRTHKSVAGTPNPVPEDELIQLKQQALQNLAPMLDHLDQTPEERFRTTMMLIQATDNAKLVREAYEAANQIEDEKIRAQALLDIVNEINYFTHHAVKEHEEPVPEV